MFKKLNTKTLLIIFAVLLLAVVLLNTVGSKHNERTFREKLFEADTSAITSFVISGKNSANDVKIVKKSKGWKVEKNAKLYNADENKIANLKNELQRLRPERIAATNRKKWKQFEVGDSLGYHVKTFVGNELVSDVVIGKFSYKQPQNPNPYSRQQGKMTSYVRLEGEDIVYAVDGFLRMSFQQEAKAYMNSYIINANKSNWTQLRFSYPSDSSFTLSNQSGKWLINGLMADSASVASYFLSIQRLSNHEFAEEIELKSTNASEYALTIEGNNMPTIVVKAKTNDGQNYLFTSSQNQGMIFKASKESLFDKLFVSSAKFRSRE